MPLYVRIALRPWGSRGLSADRKGAGTGALHGF